MLFGQPAWWNELSAEAHDLLHLLPAPHGTLVAWLERELAEHGARPWAVVREAMAEDDALGVELRQLADGDADPDATLDALLRAVDQLLEAHLKARCKTLEVAAETDPVARKQFVEAFRHWNEVKKRLSAAPAAE
jgi:DNA primase